MDLASLESAVQGYFAQGLAKSSARVYKSAQNRFLSFCEQFGLQPLPLSEPLLCNFAAFLAGQHVSSRSIKAYMSGVRHLQISTGLPDPFRPLPWARLEYVLKGIKRSQAICTPASQRERLPITPSILRRIRDHWNSQAISPDIQMLWAAFLLGFFGFLHAGEFTIPGDSAFDPQCHLMPQDVTVDCREHPTMMRVVLKQSKTDPFRLGVPIFLGRSQGGICPVAAMLTYLAVRGMDEGPLFRFADGRPLTRRRLVCHLRDSLRDVGVSCDKFSGHSFRIGAATTAAACGVEDSLIKTLGRWESAAYQRYIRLPREKLAEVSAILGSHTAAAGP